MNSKTISRIHSLQPTWLAATKWIVISQKTSWEVLCWFLGLYVSYSCFLLLVTGAPSHNLRRKLSSTFPGLVLRIRTLGRCSEYILWSATFSPQSMLLQQSKNVQCDTVTCERRLKSLKRPTPHPIPSLLLVGSMWGGKSSQRNFTNPYVVGLFSQSSSPARVSLVNPGSLADFFSYLCRSIRWVSGEPKKMWKKNTSGKEKKLHTHPRWN